MTGPVVTNLSTKNSTPAMMDTVAAPSSCGITMSWLDASPPRNIARDAMIVLLPVSWVKGKGREALRIRSWRA